MTPLICTGCSLAGLPFVLRWELGRTIAACAIRTRPAPEGGLEASQYRARLIQFEVLMLPLFDAVVGKRVVNVGLKPVPSQAAPRATERTAVEHDDRPPRACRVEQRRHVPADSRDAGHFREAAAVELER
jgi:hypothetical protein